MTSTIGDLGINGKLLVLGAPHEPLAVPVGPLLAGRRSIESWYSGTSIDSQDTLSFGNLTAMCAMTEVICACACRRSPRPNDERKGSV
jgi:alcohol dehydrogenase/propanol-preferring alcohol dehydrogenase